MKKVLSILLVTLSLLSCKKENDSIPDLKLYGPSVYQIVLNSDYIEPGYSATDKKDGSLSNAVKISGDVIKNIEGDYTLNYSVTNSLGNEISKTRIVRVKNLVPGRAALCSNNAEFKDNCINTYNAVITPDPNDEYNSILLNNFNKIPGLFLSVKIEGYNLIVKPTTYNNINWSGSGTINGTTLKLDYTQNGNNNCHVDISTN